MDSTGVIYKIPCANCDMVYVGETSRKLSTRLEEHRTEAEHLSQGHFTRSQEYQSQHALNKSAVTDHCVLNNHVIDWNNTKILDHDNRLETRWIRESLHIKKAGRNAMNRDMGQHPTPEVYFPVLRNLTGGADHHRKSAY